MFVTLKNFFENFRIRNGDKPNETVFNRPLFRLKREIRELKSVQDIIAGVAIEPWSSVKYYERDEYITYNNKFYRSVNDGNVGYQPDISVNEWVEENPVRFYTKDEINNILNNITAGNFLADDTLSPTSINAVQNKVLYNILQTLIKYNIKTVQSGYSLSSDDFTGNTIVRVDSELQNANITVTLPPDETFIGKKIIIRKINGNDSQLYINSANGVTLSPNDASTLRRDGSTATLVYIGNGFYDIFGELP